MAQLTRHIGKLRNVGSRCVVVFMQIPGDPHHCLTVDIDSLPPKYQDALTTTVSGKDAQNSVELFDVLNRNMFPTGGVMLQTLHNEGLLAKHHISEIVMTPSPHQTIPLIELLEVMGRLTKDELESPNKPQADIKEDIARQLTNSPAEQVEAVVEAPQVVAESDTSDADRAKGLIVQAELAEQDAKSYREQAYKLDPSLKPKARTARKPAAKKAPAKKTTAKKTTTKSS